MNAHQLSTRQSRRQRSHADFEAEEIDEIESLPRDAEHDEDERDPDPERYGALSEHAQEQRHGRRPEAQREHHRPR